MRLRLSKYNQISTTYHDWYGRMSGKVTAPITLFLEYYAEINRLPTGGSDVGIGRRDAGIDQLAQGSF
ncbi:hypothetical protein ARSEF1564_007924 [Beauveria bassiana]